MVVKTIWDLKDPFGRPRFYAPGEHPATRRMRAHLAKLEELRDECARKRVDATETQRAIDWVKDQLAAFEEGESITKCEVARVLSA